jgi:UDP-N-acetylmuramate-alanine ligase
MVAAAAKPGDVILTLGAGSVSQAGDRILEALRAAHEAERSSS